MVVRSHEGREPVAPARVERTGARARGEQATHPGGVGAPPGGQYGPPARSMGHRGRNVRRTFVRNGEAGGEYDRLRKARPDAEGERRNGAPGRRHVFARRRAHTDQSRRLARRPLSSRRREKTKQTSGAGRAARTKEAALNDE